MGTGGAAGVGATTVFTGAEVGGTAGAGTIAVTPVVVVVTFIRGDADSLYAAVIALAPEQNDVEQEEEEQETAFED